MSETREVSCSGEPKITMSQPVLVDKTITCRGFTFIEMLIAVVLLGAMTSIAFPRMRDGIMRQSVRSATDAIRVLHARARSHASQRGQPTVIDLKNGIVAIRSTSPLTGTPDTLGVVHNMHDRFGVTVSATRDSLVFDGRGIGMEGSATLVYVNRESYADTIQISALGRIQ